MSHLDRFFVISVVLLASVFPVELFPNTVPVHRGADGQFSGKQGQVIVIKVPEVKDATIVKGRFLGRTVTLFPDPSSKG
ncbi:MAG TPA: M23 family peptidase, partial [Nitrospira sp.]|nr:M23 family peptidase [Nitrospira sp.]